MNKPEGNRTSEIPQDSLRLWSSSGASVCAHTHDGNSLQENMLPRALEKAQVKGQRRQATSKGLSAGEVM